MGHYTRISRREKFIKFKTLQRFVDIAEVCGHCASINIKFKTLRRFVDIVLLLI